MHLHPYWELQTNFRVRSFLDLVTAQVARLIDYLNFILKVWRLLRAIYRPHNYYCIHMDKKSPRAHKKWLIRKIANCISPETSKNIFFIDSISVYHSTMSVLNADLGCMRALWQLPQKDANSVKPWKYVINLTGQEFPLKNNLELTRILRVLNNANLIQQLKWVNMAVDWIMFIKIKADWRKILFCQSFLGILKSPFSVYKMFTDRP